jgi:hypothetical protein
MARLHLTGIAVLATMLAACAVPAWAQGRSCPNGYPAEGDPIWAEWRQGVEAYKHKDYPKAIRILTDLITTKGCAWPKEYAIEDGLYHSDYLPQFYLALAWAGLKNADEARRYYNFIKVRQRENGKSLLTPDHVKMYNEAMQSGLHGTIRDKSGQPVRAVTLRLLGPGSSFEAVTGPQGQFDFRQVQAGGYQLQIAAARGFSGTDMAVALSPGDVRVLDVELLRPITLGGTVRNQGRQPVFNAIVRLRPVGLGSAAGRQTTTDSEGRYSFSPLDAGRYRLQVEAAGFNAEEKTIDLTSGESVVTDMDIEPRPSITLSGTVRDQNGRPVPGALVSLVEPGSAPGQRRETDADGRFSFPGLEMRQYELRVEAPTVFRAATKTVDLTRGKPAPMDIELEALPRPEPPPKPAGSPVMKPDVKPLHTSNADGAGSPGARPPRPVAVEVVAPEEPDALTAAQDLVKALYPTDEEIRRQEPDLWGAAERAARALAKATNLPLAVEARIHGHLAAAYGRLAAFSTRPDAGQLADRAHQEYVEATSLDPGFTLSDPIPVDVRKLIEQPGQRPAEREGTGRGGSPFWPLVFFGVALVLAIFCIRWWLVDARRRARSPEPTVPC